MNLVAGGYPADAAGRAYYAMFHAATAMALWRGLEARTHSGLATLMATKLIETGDFQRAHVAQFRKAMETRTLTDYDAGFRLPAPDLERMVESARQFLTHVEQLIGGLES